MRIIPGLILKFKDTEIIVLCRIRKANWLIMGPNAITLNYSEEELQRHIRDGYFRAIGL